MYGGSARIRTEISRLSVATCYKHAVLPLNYRTINCPLLYPVELRARKLLPTQKRAGRYPGNVFRLHPISRTGRAVCGHIPAFSGRDIYRADPLACHRFPTPPLLCSPCSYPARGLGVVAGADLGMPATKCSAKFLAGQATGFLTSASACAFATSKPTVANQL